ncbi:MAG TPA: hypothetical protein VJQ44_07045 [Gemmatimonadales bacterium]|nr:hypothetical protein [Gemmatimonadales bacterium]
MRERLARDFERFARGLPADFPGYVREGYRIDLSARYLGYALPHPIGKGSGQLSLNLDQLETDRAAGLAFVVLKTVIAEDPSGSRTMGAWAIHETRMKVEPIRSVSGRSGWTVTWKGRGWDRSFDDYLALVRAAGDLTRSGFPAVPSAKFHLPLLDEPFRGSEYHHTTAALARAWGEPALALEKDFSPTLAGDPLADERGRVLRWLAEVPREIRAAAGDTPVRLALKLMNARYDDDFQLAMLDAAAGADALVCFNRLWSAERGVAYGGPELSERNLRVLAAAAGRRHPPLAGTGDICSGRRVLEYARAGCECVQLHTFFQLPLSEYPATEGSRTGRALHALVFHPERGLIAGLLELEEQGILHRQRGELRFRDLVPSQATAARAAP